MTYTVRFNRIILSLIASFLCFTCIGLFDDDEASTTSGEDTGSMIGRVLDKDNKPVKDVVASLVGRDNFVITDEDGYFKFNLPSETTTLTKTAATFESDTLILAYKEQTFYKNPVSLSTDTLPPIILGSVQTMGSFSISSTSVSRITASFQTLAEPSSLAMTAQLNYNSTTNIYSGTLYYTYTSPETKYGVQISVYGLDNTLLARIEDFHFLSDSSQIIAPTVSIPDSSLLDSTKATTVNDTDSSPLGPLPKSVYEWDGDESNMSDLPQTISELGFDTNQTNLFIPYQVNVPLYSDLLGARRYVSVPTGKAITPDDSLFYQFPEGTAFFRQVWLDTVYGNPISRKYIELQLMVRAKDNTWRALTYVYRDNQTDGDLVNEDSFILNENFVDHFPLNLGYIDSSSIPPSPAMSGNFQYFRTVYDCWSCHFNSSANGFITQQLNIGSQLTDLVNKGVLSSMPNLSGMEAAGKVTKWHALDDPTASVEQKSRSYLATQCGNCHIAIFEREQAGLTSNFSYFTERNIIVDLSSEQLIVPGKPDSSYLLNRMINSEMPAAGVSVPDAVGIKVLWDWINSLGGGTTAFPGIPISK